MEINSGLNIGFIPATIGDRPAAPAKENLRSNNETATTTQQAVVTVSETERQAARQQFDQQNRDREQRESNLGPDQPGIGSPESRALEAYQQTQANDENNYLSQILGIDTFA